MIIYSPYHNKAILFFQVWGSLKTGEGFETGELLWSSKHFFWPKQSLFQVGRDWKLKVRGIILKWKVVWSPKQSLSKMGGFDSWNTKQFVSQDGGTWLLIIVSWQTWFWPQWIPYSQLSFKCINPLIPIFYCNVYFYFLCKYMHYQFAI